MKRNLILGGITLSLLLLGMIGCVLAGNTRTGTIAVITQNGQERYRIDLSEVDAPYTISLTGEEGAENIILVENGAISMQSANCPDGLCRNMGRMTSGGLPIVCLPHHIMIEVKGGTADEAEIDVQVY